MKFGIGVHGTETTSDIMAAAVVDLRAKRTKAVAPRSLFGTVIEIKDEEALAETERAKSVPKPTKPNKLAPYRDPNAPNIIQAEEEQLRRQIHKAKQAKGNLQETQLNAVHFSPDESTIKSQIPKGALTFTPKREYSPYQSDIKHNPRNIALGEQFNRLGLDQKMDYNYDRYRGPKTNSKFQQSGTVLGKGGLLSYKGQSYATVNGLQKNRSGARLPPVESPSKAPGGIYYIPPNIRHIYGDSLCDQLLENKKEFRQSMEAKLPERRRTAASRSPVHIELKSEPLYDALGNALRQDIFNGVSHSHIQSLNTSSYTEDIPTKSTETYPPKFGVQRNQDSKWNEDNVLRQRMKKQWDAMLQGNKKD